MKISKMTNKDVVDVNTATKLGRIKDVEIDVETGKVKSFDIVLNMKISNLIRNKSKIQVLWEDVKNIGDEVILISQNKD